MLCSCSDGNGCSFNSFKYCRRRNTACHASGGCAWAPEVPCDDNALGLESGFKYPTCGPICVADWNDRFEGQAIAQFLEAAVLLDSCLTAVPCTVDQSTSSRRSILRHTILLYHHSRQRLTARLNLDPKIGMNSLTVDAIQECNTLNQSVPLATHFWQTFLSHCHDFII